jgi:BNR repeat-like domain
MRCGAALLLLLCACSGEPEEPSSSLTGVIKVSGNAPWPSSCAGPRGGGSVSTNAEVEPFVAIDPKDPKHLIGTWQQDRWSTGGSNGLLTAASFDGGHSWTVAMPRLSRCSNGTYQRATDPWVTISPSGLAYHIGYAFDVSAPNRAMLVSRSGDGGRSWNDPIALQVDNAANVAMDKETITADPLDGNYVYAVWDRLTGLDVDRNPNGTGPAWFARTTDAGATWETARVIYDPGPDTQTISNQIAVLPDGTLIDALLVITKNSTDNPVATVAVLRSTDRGVSWSTAHVPVATSQFVGVSDPKSKHPIRTGSVVPNVAVDRTSGAIYIAWEDARFSGLARDGIALSKSIDGGLKWSDPVQVNGAPNSPAFTPGIAVAANGTVGVSYYDLRNDNPADASHLLVTQWLATSADGGATFSESPVTGPFDVRNAPLVDGQAYFLGDYQGLTHDGTGFVPFFAAVPGGGPSDIFFRPADGAVASGGPLRVAARGVQQLWRGARERWRFGTLFK